MNLRFILLPLYFLISIAATASTYIVTNTSDDKSNFEGSLRWAIEKSNKDSEYSDIIFSLPEESTVITLNEPIMISKPLEINGEIKDKKIKIEAQQSSNIFICNNFNGDDRLNLVFKNIEFGKNIDNSSKKEDAQILLDTINGEKSANAIFSNVIFNDTIKHAYGIFASAHWNIELISSKFCNNHQTNVSLGKSLRANNIKFSNNASSLYSYMYPDSIFINRCSFDNNQSSVNLCAKHIEVRNSEFSKTKNEYALCLKTNSITRDKVIIDSCSFENNSEGAIRFLNTIESLDIDIRNCSFKNNDGAAFLGNREFSDKVGRICFTNNIVSYLNLTGKEGSTAKGIVTSVDTMIITGNKFDIESELPVIDAKRNDTCIIDSNIFHGAYHENAIKLSVIYDRKKISKKKHIPYYTINDNLFDGTDQYGILITDTVPNVLISRNQFINTDRVAIKNARQLAIPEITKVYGTMNKLFVKGKVDSMSTVELFYSSDEKQSAIKYIGITNTLEDSSFVFSIPYDSLPDLGKICFSATATYGGIHTSDLTDPYCTSGNFRKINVDTFYCDTIQHCHGINNGQTMLRLSGIQNGECINYHIEKIDSESTSLKSELSNYKKVGGYMNEGHCIYPKGIAIFSRDDLGPGTYRITAKYENGDYEFTEESIIFDTTITIKALENPFSIKAEVKSPTYDMQYSKAVYKVSNWSDLYSATLNGDSVSPTSVEKRTAIFSFDSLTASKYIFKVEDECNNWKADTVTFSSMNCVKIEAKKGEVKCSDVWNTLIIAKADDNEYDREVYLLRDDSIWVKSSSFENGAFKKTVIGAKQYIAIKAIKDECVSYAKFEEYDEDSTTLAKTSVNISTENQKCYGEKECKISVILEGNKSEYTTIAVATDIKTKKEFTSLISDNDTLEIVHLDSGRYAVRIELRIGNCIVGENVRMLDTVDLRGIKHALAIIDTVAIHSKCHRSFEDTMKIFIHGWEEGYSWKYQLDNGNIFESQHANNVSNGNDTVGIVILEKNLGTGHFSAWNGCKDTIKLNYEIKPLEKPYLRIIEDSSYINLRCSQENGYVSFVYGGGDKANSRIYMEYQSPSDADFLETLPSDSILRINEFHYGKHSDTLLYTTDLDKSKTGNLQPGDYTIVYQNTSENCKDYAIERFSITRPEPIKLLLCKNDVRCFGEKEGSVCFVPERKDQYSVKYTTLDDEDREYGTNWASTILLPGKMQQIVYRSNGIIDPTNPSSIFKSKDRFRSDVFSDTKKIEISAKNTKKETLYTHLYKDNMKTSLKGMWNNGNYESVPVDWIGFNTLAADTYYVSITDTLDCVYTDSFVINNPANKKLEIINIDKSALEEGYCDADKRRISITATGGWGEYIFSIKNMDEEKANTQSPSSKKEMFGSLLDDDYVYDTKFDTMSFINSDGDLQESITFRSAILKPGRNIISVLDKEFCYVIGDTIDVKAKYNPNIIPITDVCGEDNNEIQITSNILSIDHFALRIGHATIDEDSVEIRDNLHGKITTIYKISPLPTLSLGGIPSGKIGVYSIMRDGCSSFTEFDFEKKDGFKPIKLKTKELMENLCYTDESGEIRFELNGGNERYKEIYLDGVSLKNLTKKKLIIKNNSSEHFIPIINDIYSDQSFYNLLNNKIKSQSEIEAIAYASLKKDATYADSVNAYNNTWQKILNMSDYYISIGNLPWGNFAAPDSSHYLVATDIKGCSDTLAFRIPHPDKLEVEVASSPVCMDGAGRLFVTNVKGGKEPYMWKLDDMTKDEYDMLFSENNKNHPQKMLEDKIVDFVDYYDFIDFYVENFQDSDHLPAVVGYPHRLIVKDANNCIGESDEKMIDMLLTWDEIEPDYMISTWHDYDNVLVVIDKTNYDNLKYKSNKKEYPYTYDSVHVEVVMKDISMRDKIVATPQYKELYTYGVADKSSMDGSASTGVNWRGTTYTTPSWGLPRDVASSVRSDDEYEKVASQFAFEIGNLESQIKVRDSLIHTCDTLLNNYKFKPYEYEAKAKLLVAKELWQEQRKELKDSLNELKDKDYTKAICTISQIRESFDQLICDSASKRMTFVKLESTKSGSGIISDLFSKKGELPFIIKVTSFINGCDITTEYNDMHLSFGEQLPYPVVNYKETMTISLLQNPVTDGKASVHISINKPVTQDNSLKYYVVDATGRLFKKAECHAADLVSESTDEEGHPVYTYAVTIDGLSQQTDYVFVAETKNRIESVQIVSK